MAIQFILKYLFLLFGLATTRGKGIHQVLKCLLLPQFTWLGCTSKRAAIWLMVYSPRMASTATRALNAAVYDFRFIVTCTSI